MDNTTIHPASADRAHHIDLHLWRGPPENRDPDRPVQILVNDGYIVGFSPDRLQPLWSAYRVALAEQDVDFERPIHYHDDLRLPPEQRIGRRTFGKLGNIGLHVGHMTPNEVTNRQFGRLAQMETFLMSNMSPQYGTLNTGVWSKLEKALREIEDDNKKGHVWVIVGPIFGQDPVAINRGHGKMVPVPEGYFCIAVDPHSYPFDRISNVHIDCFIFPQDAPGSGNPDDFPATLEEIEEATNLKFFTGWGRDVDLAMAARALQAKSEAPSSSRLQQVLERKAQEWAEPLGDVPPAQPTGKTFEELLDALRAEAAALQKIGRVLTPQEETRVATVQHTISWLLAAQATIGKKKPEPEKKPANFITYKIANDMDGRLKQAARTSCNFWNRFVEPYRAVVIRLDIFTSTGNVIARAYKPYEKDDTVYGRVEFNTKFLFDYTPAAIAGTVVHEIGHTLGIGWDDWKKLFHQASGRFKSAAVRRIAALADMEVERDFGPGTQFSHWDEEIFDRELMTGFKDAGEFVMPVTIDIMTLFGHDVIERLPQTTQLDDLLADAANSVFMRQDEARELDLDHFEKTDVFETLPHPKDEPRLDGDE